MVAAALVLLPSSADAATAGGGVMAYGAPDHGSTEGVLLNAPIVDVAPSPDGTGYWEVASDGGVFAFGGAHYAGSLGNIKLNQPIVGMTPTPSGRGYWLVAADGGVFTFGDAPFLGSAGDRGVHDVVSITSPSIGGGYWLASASGAVYAFGALQHWGDLSAKRPASPVVGITPTPLGKGYWLATADGGVYTFGGATFAGSLGGQRLDEPVVGIEAASSKAYWLVTRDGGVYSYGGAPFAGAAANACKDAVIGLMAHRGGGYWLGTTPLPPATIPPGTAPLDRTAAESHQLTSLLRLRQGCQPGASARKGVLAHPLPGSRITTSYGPRTHPIYHQPQVHTGTDFAGKPTAFAAAAGTVVEVRLRNGYGLTVVVDHGNGIATSYSHLARAAVSSGQRVTQGQTIGTVGHTGDATGDHLHFEVRVHGLTTDPMTWL
jgi:hypothetical protein